MSECRHGADLDEYNCMNCDDDTFEFEKWWREESGWGDGEKLAEYQLAKAAWFGGIKRVVDDMGLGL